MKRLQGFVAGVLVGTLCAGAVAYATVGTQTIEVEYDNIKVYKDNVLCELKDANGSTVEPFIYNGTTYLPVRASAGLADMEVEWDGATSSIKLWDELVPEGTYLLDVCLPYETSYFKAYTGVDSFYMAGEKYTNGFTLGSMWGNTYALFNLNSKYSEINFTIGHVDGTAMCDNTVYFYLDGNLIKEVEIGSEDLPKTVSLPVQYGLQLKIYNPGNGDSRIGFGNVTIH